MKSWTIWQCISRYLTLNREIPLWILGAVIIILNSYGIVRMFQAFQSIKFENYVLLSGVIEVICFLLYKAWNYDFIVLIIQFLQIIITLFISRRFLRLYLLLEKESKSQLFNIYFALLVIANVVFIIVLIVFTVIDYRDTSGNQRDEMVSYAHSIFSALVSVLLFYFGMKIANMIETASKESDQHRNVDYYLEEEGEADKVSAIQSDKPQDKDNASNDKSNEIYLTTRRQQLYIVAIANLITDCFECLLMTLELFAFPEHFYFSVATYPLTATGYAIFALQQVSMLSSSLFNFIAFYYVVRGSYETQHKKPAKKIVMENELTSSLDAKANSNITDYLSNE